jgi:hypothetical protein
MKKYAVMMLAIPFILTGCPGNGTDYKNGTATNDPSAKGSGPANVTNPFPNKASGATGSAK